MVKRATGLGGTCLSRSFALWALLRKRGVEAELVVGYRRGTGERSGKIEGHAWLEFEGGPINEEPAVARTYTTSIDLKAFDLWGLPGREERTRCGENLVDLKGFEPLTSSMPWKRAPNCATGPLPKHFPDDNTPARSPGTSPRRTQPSSRGILQ